MTASRKVVVLTLLACLALLLSSGCNKINELTKGIPGKVQGQLLDKNGAGRGYVSVVLKEVETGKEAYQQNAEDSGNFFFDQVEPAKYIIVTYLVGQTPVPNNCKEFVVTPGKTIMQNVILEDVAKKESSGTDY